MRWILHGHPGLQTISARTWLKRGQKAEGVVHGVFCHAPLTHCPTLTSFGYPKVVACAHSPNSLFHATELPIGFALGPQANMVGLSGNSTFHRSFATVRGFSFSWVLFLPNTIDLLKRLEQEFLKFRERPNLHSDYSLLLNHMPCSYLGRKKERSWGSWIWGSWARQPRHVSTCRHLRLVSIVCRQVSTPSWYTVAPHSQFHWQDPPNMCSVQCRTCTVWPRSDSWRIVFKNLQETVDRYGNGLLCFKTPANKKDTTVESRAANQKTGSVSMMTLMRHSLTMRPSNGGFHAWITILFEEKECVSWWGGGGQEVCIKSTFDPHLVKKYCFVFSWWVFVCGTCAMFVWPSLGPEAFAPQPGMNKSPCRRVSVGGLQNNQRTSPVYPRTKNKARLTNFHCFPPPTESRCRQLDDMLRETIMSSFCQREGNQHFITILVGVFRSSFGGIWPGTCSPAHLFTRLNLPRPLNLQWKQFSSSLQCQSQVHLRVDSSTGSAVTW